MTKETDKYDADIRKAVDTAEKMRNGGPNNVLWLIVQQIRYLAGLLIGVHVKLDKLLKGSGGDSAAVLNRLNEVVLVIGLAFNEVNADLRDIKQRLDELQPPEASKAAARIVVRGPVTDR